MIDERAVVKLRKQVTELEELNASYLKEATDMRNEMQLQINEQRSRVGQLERESDVLKAKPDD